MLMRYSWKWSAGLRVQQNNSQLVQEIHSFLLNSNINTVLYFCCTLLLEEHLCHSRWKKMWWALVCAADTDSNMGVEMVSVSWCIFVLRSGKERNIFSLFICLWPLFPPKISEVFTLWMMWIMLDCTCEVGLGAAGFVAGAAEGPGWPGVTVLRLWAATSQTSHLAVCPVHHLYELSHPGERWKEVRKD